MILPQKTPLHHGCDRRKHLREEESGHLHLQAKEECVQMRKIQLNLLLTPPPLSDKDCFIKVKLDT